MLENGKRKGSAMNIEIAQRLYELRRRHGFSQEQLAAELGLSRQAISKWERSESAPDMGNLIALADLYGMTIDELIRPAAENDEQFVEDDSEACAIEDVVDADDADAQVDNADAQARTATDTYVYEVVATGDADAITEDTGGDTDVADEQAEENSDTFDFASQYDKAASADTKQVYAHGHMYTKPVNTNKKPKCALRRFPYPLLVTVIFLVLALVFGFWEYIWLFLTIPFYYWIARVIERDPLFLESHGYTSTGQQAPQGTQTQQSNTSAPSPNASPSNSEEVQPAYAAAYSVDEKEVH